MSLCPCCIPPPDEVPSPIFVRYREMIRACMGKPSNDTVLLCSVSSCSSENHLIRWRKHWALRHLLDGQARQKEQEEQERTTCKRNCPYSTQDMSQSSS